MTQKPARDPAPAGMREQVGAAASQAWQRPAEALYLGRASRIRVRYEVPTLRRDGTVRGHQWVRRSVTKLPLAVCYLILGVFLIIWYVIQFVIDAVLNGNSTDFYAAPRWKRRLAVRADAPTGLAMPAGRAAARTRGQVWLVVAPTAAAIIQVVDGRQTVLWTENGPRHPVLAIKERELRWPDGSVLTFELPRGEHAKFRANRRDRG